MKKFSALTFLILLATANTITADWTTFRGDQTRSGYNSAASELSIPVPVGTITIAEPGVNLSQPIKFGNYIYVGTGEGKVIKIDTSTGLAITGQFQTGGPIAATGLIQDGIIYIVIDGYLYFLNTI